MKESTPERCMELWNELLTLIGNSDNLRSHVEEFNKCYIFAPKVDVKLTFYVTAGVVVARVEHVKLDGIIPCSIAKHPAITAAAVYADFTYSMDIDNEQDVNNILDWLQKHYSSEHDKEQA